MRLGCGALQWPRDDSSPGHSIHSGFLSCLRLAPAPLLHHHRPPAVNSPLTPSSHPHLSSPFTFLSLSRLLSPSPCYHPPRPPISFYFPACLPFHAAVPVFQPVQLAVHLSIFSVISCCGIFCIDALDVPGLSQFGGLLNFYFYFLFIKRPFRLHVYVSGTSSTQSPMRTPL